MLLTAKILHVVMWGTLMHLILNENEKRAVENTYQKHSIQDDFKTMKTMINLITLMTMLIEDYLFFS